MDGNEAKGDLVLIQTFLLYYVNQVILMLLKTSIFQEQFHNKAERVCIKTRSPSASLPSITVKWPIENQKFKRRTKVCNIWQHLVTDTGLLFMSLKLNWILVFWGLSQFFCKRTVNSLLCYTFVFTGHKIWSQKNFYVIFGYFTSSSVLLKGHLYSERDTFP